MIIKEYRIPMPLGTEEYKIAQLYMIAKKSKLESEGEGNGVEIVTNQPYTDGPGGGGQYTDKIYHVEAHLPYWLRGFLPRSLAIIREEAWNAYPYSKNRIFIPDNQKFSIDIESKYLTGGWDQDNVFELNSDELSQRIVDVIDYVKDDYTSREKDPEKEDPTFYKSKKTGRGPLSKDWLDQYKSNYVGKNNSDNDESKNNSNETGENSNLDNIKNFMCVYKICRVKFEQWGFQTRVEQFIQDYIRKTLVGAHRQAWAWQDEWHGLDMNQIRAMEQEVQESLANLMRKEGDKTK